MSKSIAIFFSIILVSLVSGPLTCNGADSDPSEGQEASLVILTSDRKAVTC